VSAAAERTSASACASAWAILASAILVPPHDEVFHFGLGLGGETLGFGFSAGNDGRRLALRPHAPCARIRQARLAASLAQPNRLSKLSFDARLTLVDAVDHAAMRARYTSRQRKMTKAIADPGFGFGS